MAREFLVQHWALFGALGMLAVVGLQVILSGVAQSSSGQLRRAVSDKQEQDRIARKARAVTAKAEARLDALLKRSDKVRPSALQECKEALQDARALQKIAEDKLLIAENPVRRVIHEEFPPVRQEKLRARYLPHVARDRRPCSF
jgi:hypothetical protein